MALSLRHMTAADLPQVSTLLSESFRAAYNEAFPEELFQKALQPEHMLSRWTKRLETRKSTCDFLVAVPEDNADQVVGMIEVGPPDTKAYDFESETEMPPDVG